MSQKTDNGALIRTRDVKKVYQDNGVPVNAVRGVDLEVRSGEFAAIVGPSGSGKTTFLNLISGLDTPTEGEVWLAGRKISTMSGRELSDYRRDHIGFIFQAYNLIPVLSVEENIEYIMLLQGLDKSERHKRVQKVLAELGLDGFADRLPTKLSGGQQQRVAVARAIVSEPDLVLADEPTANLDSTTSKELIELMLSLNQKHGITFLISTHDPLVIELAPRQITLRDGTIVGDESA